MHVCVANPNPIPNQVRRKAWSAEECRAWPTAELAMGMFDRAG